LKYITGRLKHDELVGWVRERDGRLQTAREGYAPAMLVAKLIADHLTSWCGDSGSSDSGSGGGGDDGDGERSAASPYFNSVGLWSDGNSYGAPEGLFFSFPAKVVGGSYTVVEGLPVPLATRLEINKIGVSEASHRTTNSFFTLGIEI
jgi:hypothetical protein